ncbi:MAG: VWA domain-containing protein [Bryobacteraceae bacterium]
MTFARSWVLFLAWLPLAWIFWEWSRSQRPVSLLLKGLSLFAILVALAEPVLRTDETKLAVGILADTSSSLSPDDLGRASQIANSINDARGRHIVRLIPFARTTRDAGEGEINKPWKLRQTAGESGRATDLEAAVRESIAALPSGMVPRLALISDGRENKGSVARAAWQARELGIPIDTFPLKGRAEPKLKLESVSLPSVAFAGEKFPIDLVVTSPVSTQATVEIAAEGKPLGKNPVTLEAGTNRLRAHAALNTAGAVDLSVALKSDSLGEVRFDQAMNLRRPKVLYMTSDAAENEKNLLSTLAAAQFDVERVTDFPKTPLAEYQIVTFNNWDLENVPAARKEEVEQYVKQGGGLLVIGGEKNIYVEGKKVEDALDRTLPAKLAPPRSPEGTCVILIIDKSSSMEGRKMELARVAAIGVVDNLRPIDLIGVLIFDNSFQWAVPVRRAEDKTLIKRLISGITPDGGTQIAPALTESFRRIVPTTATYKHIVLLTDGISEEGDSLDLSREAALKKVTISTVGLGQDVNRAYLEKVATLAGGKSYFLNEPQGLEKILLKDVMEHTGSTTVEKPLQPTVVKQAEILEGVAMETAPALRGYVKFIAKPTAEAVLSIDKDPLFTRWQLGLGRAAVFTSDAKSRWATDWVTWKGFDKFWTNVYRDLLPQAQAGEASVELDSANSELVVDYRLSREMEASLDSAAKIPAIFIIGPDGFQKPVPVKKLAAGAYRGRVNIGQRQGLFRIRPVADSRVFPEAGFYRPEAELTEFGANEALLKQVAEFTGGRFNPSPSAVFSATGRSIASSIRLWPGLLALAILLNLAELVLRKWKGIFGLA